MAIEISSLTQNQGSKFGVRWMEPIGPEQIRGRDCTAPRAPGHRAGSGAVERGAQGSESSGGFLSGERRAGERRADEKTGVKREQQQLVGRPFNGAVDVRVDKEDIPLQ